MAEEQPSREQQRERAIRLRLVRSEDRPRGVLATGFALDRAMGGGFPRGAIVELFGPPASGKTTLALQIVAKVQKNGATAAWIDAEHVFDASYAALLGVRTGEMPLARPTSAEEALEIACRLTGSRAVELLVVDSAAALVPRLELESGIGDGGAGLQSRVLASGLRKLSRAARHSGAVILFLNQTRSRRGGSGGEEEASAGGAPLKLYAAARIALESRAGGRVRFRMLKNRLSAGDREGWLRRAESGEFVPSP